MFIALMAGCFMAGALGALLLGFLKGTGAAFVLCLVVMGFALWQLGPGQNDLIMSLAYGGPMIFISGLVGGALGGWTRRRMGGPGR